MVGVHVFTEQFSKLGTSDSKVYSICPNVSALPVVHIYYVCTMQKNNFYKSTNSQCSKSCKLPVCNPRELLVRL